MERSIRQSDPEFDDRAFACADALPARFAETLETLRITRARVVRMRGIVRAAAAIGRTDGARADLSSDDGAA